MKLTLKHAIVAFGVLTILAACGGGGGDTPAPVDPGPTLEERQADQRDAIETAIGTAQTAVAAVDNDSTNAEVGAADSAIVAARSAIAAAVDVPAAEKSANTGTVNALASRLTAAKNARQMAMDDARDAADAAMMALAAKLYPGIYAPAADATGTEVGDVHAAYNADDSAIVVTIGDGTSANANNLSEDKKTMVADNHGWKGKRYADPAGGPMVEAVVYSNVEAPTQGRKFGSAEPGTGETRAFEYMLVNGVLNADNADGVGATDNVFVAARVGFTNVTRTAGTETFSLPSPNPNDVGAINIPGSYHGVPGTYKCVPAAGTTSCTASVAASGFTLSTADTWTFTPGNANAMVTEMTDSAYASYGWWIHKAENDGDFTASAFHDFKGTAGTVDIADLVGGTATYMGGATGKYALHSTTGGTNDAGHFTASAMLEADFEDDMIMGTIDNFMGADGMSRNWSVELMEQGFSSTGQILGDDGSDGGTAKMTKWTIDGTTADAAGSWSGNLREEGSDGVPKVVTGTFYSEFGRDAGKMVGAFGANKDD
ncbi:MAG: hypothetical protein OXI81_01870 [Paracoccaceae bacterium]|nr:hypothetical protein [Paracoccaceae bacterium]